MIVIRRACFPADRAAVVAIWRAYLASTATDLSFQNNEREFADLPGRYVAPHGTILLADDGGTIVGCIAMRRVDDRICEMKRLYVGPTARGRALGKRLVERLIAEATAAGHAEMRLDVLAEFAAARRLYASLGFGDAPPVAVNPVAGTAFLGRVLR
ncbi:MAG: GNAT family N-acetyltransferase [Sphingomonas sp.]|uniref:GNAT family N-acetyltransferase n=1 Tax=Sphingomonas sp. TaxID=28214 RepID=UPI001AD392CC|nr:GNAT family N-acetyltransferase [Sphingomonas sp.]MBN8808749.1 GNAT family N-acetyltransferase [Sphingomonas sp.]